MLMLCFLPLYAAEPITIDSECVMLEDIFPGIGIKDEVFCGLDYGETKVINRQMTMYIINKHNIQGVRPGEVAFRRSGTLLTEDRLRRDMTDLLSVMYGEIDVEITGVRMGREFYFSDKEGYSLDIPKGRFGNVSVGVDNGIRRYNYTANLTAYKEIYVSKGSIRKGDDIDNLTGLERYDLSKVRGEPIDDPKNLIAVRNISAGKPVTTADVMVKPDALAETTVSIVYDSGSLSVATTGELMEDAYIGKNVRVKNTSSGKIVRGVFLEGRKVLVNP
jgi:flagella basal body P-ring formation protein FlgA